MLKILEFCRLILSTATLQALQLEVFIVYLSFIILGFFFLFFFKRNILNISEYLRINYRSAAVSGAAGVILTPVIFGALLFTIIGSVLLPAFVFMYVFFLLFAFYSAALLIGELLMRLFTFRNHIYVELLLGTTVLFFSIFIPFAGSILFLLFLLLGMGGVLNLRFGAVD